ncbi:MAG: hypothetical protein RJA07_2334 [Bacteroidota bacterium]|jgi:hypothetical protein
MFSKNSFKIIYTSAILSCVLSILTFFILAKEQNNLVINLIVFQIIGFLFVACNFLVLLLSSINLIKQKIWTVGVSMILFVLSFFILIILFIGFIAGYGRTLI